MENFQEIKSFLGMPQQSIYDTSFSLPLIGYVSSLKYFRIIIFCYHIINFILLFRVTVLLQIPTMMDLENTYIRKLNISKCNSLQLGTLVGHITKLYHPCDHSIKHIDIRDCIRPSRFDDPENKKKKRIEAIEYIENLRLHQEYMINVHIDNINNIPCTQCSSLRKKSFFELIDDLIYFQNSQGKRFWDSFFIAPEKLPPTPQAYDKKYSYLNIHIEDAIEFCKLRFIKLCFKDYFQEKFVPLSFNDFNDSKKMELENKMDAHLKNLSLNKINKKSSNGFDRYTPPFLTKNSRSLTNIVIHITWLLFYDENEYPTPDQVFEKLKDLAEECKSGQKKGYFKPLNHDEITKIKDYEVRNNKAKINWIASDGSCAQYTFEACKKTVNEWKRKMQASDWIHFVS